MTRTHLGGVHGGTSTFTGAQNIRVNHKESLVREAMRQMIDQLNAVKAAHPRDSHYELQDIIDQQPKRHLTKEEIREQTISWIRGQLPRTMQQPTREELEDLIDRGY